MSKKFQVEPDDTFLIWRWGDGSSLTINQRYYLLFMSKANRNKLDKMMKRLYAQMEVLK